MSTLVDVTSTLTAPKTEVIVAASGLTRTTSASLTVSDPTTHTDATGTSIIAEGGSTLATGSRHKTATTTTTSATTGFTIAGANTTTAPDSAPIEANTIPTTPTLGTETSASSVPIQMESILISADTGTTAAPSTARSSTTSTPTTSVGVATTAPTASSPTATVSLSAPTETSIVGANVAPETAPTSMLSPDTSTDTTLKATQTTASSVTTVPSGVLHLTAGVTQTTSSSILQTGTVASTTTSSPDPIDANGTPTPPSANYTTVPDGAYAETRHAFVNSAIRNIDLDGNVTSTTTHSHSYVDPAIDSEHNLYVLEDDTLTSYDSTYTQRWHVDDIAGTDYNTVYAVVGSDGYCYVGTESSGASITGTLRRIDPTDGSVQWTKEAGSTVYQFGAVDASGNLYNASYKGGQNVLEKIAPDGTLVWDRYVDAIEPENLVIDGANEYIYFADNSSDDLYKIDASTGATDSTRSLSNFGLINAIDESGYLYIESFDNYVGKYDWETDTYVWTYQYDTGWDQLDFAPHPGPFTGPLVIDWDGDLDGTIAIRELNEANGEITQTITTDPYESGSYELLAHPPIGGNPELWSDKTEEIYGLQASATTSEATSFEPTATSASASTATPTGAGGGTQTASGASTATLTPTPTASESTPTTTAGSVTVVATGSRTIPEAIPTLPELSAQTGAHSATVSTTSVAPTPSGDSITTPTAIRPTTVTLMETSTGAQGIVTSASGLTVTAAPLDAFVLKELLTAEPISTTTHTTAPTVTTTSGGTATTTATSGHVIPPVVSTTTEPAVMTPTATVGMLAPIRLNVNDGTATMVAPQTTMRTVSVDNGKRSTATPTPASTLMNDAIGGIGIDAVGRHPSPSTVLSTSTGTSGKTVAATKYSATAVPNVALEVEYRTRALRSGSNDVSIDGTSNSVTLDTDRSLD